MFNNGVDDNKFEMPEERPTQGPLSTGALVGIIIAFFVIAIAFILHSKSRQKVRDAQVMELEQELDADKAAMDAQKDKVVQITQQLDALKQQFDMGLIKEADKPKIMAEYHQLVQQQHAERDKFAPLADAYNAKVEKLNELK